MVEKRSQKWLEYQFLRGRFYWKLFNKKGQNLKSEWIDYIYNNVLKSDKFVHLNYIDSRIEGEYRYDDDGYELHYIDNSIPCVHYNKKKCIFVDHHELEWRHQVRHCLNELKDNGKADNEFFGENGNDIDGYWIKVR